MVRVKICGITNLEDALSASEAGADALGFVFYNQSPRYIEPHNAAKIIKALPPFVTPVGVFADALTEEVEEAISSSGVRVLQFHGSETGVFCNSFGMNYMKAFRVRSTDDLADMRKYAGASAFLLDAYSDEALGGTGKVFDWELALRAKESGRIILAGGLNPHNVADAVRKVMPYGVDVSSGVEISKGKKNHEAVRLFVANAKAAALGQIRPREDDDVT